MTDTVDAADGGAASGALPVDAACHHTTERTPSGDLDQRLVAALERLGHVARTLLAREAYVAGLSPLQMQLLHRLRAGSRSPRVSDLALELDVSQATVSAALSTLRGKELVRKEQLPHDRRNVAFTLTDEGEALRRRLDGWAQPMEAKAAALDPIEKGAALRLVLGLVADLQADGVISVARTCLTCRWFDDSAAPDAELPYRCALLDTSFADTELRVDCTEHEQAPGSSTSH